MKFPVCLAILTLRPGRSLWALSDEPSRGPVITNRILHGRYTKVRAHRVVTAGRGSR